MPIARIPVRGWIIAVLFFISGLSLLVYSCVLFLGEDVPVAVVAPQAEQLSEKAPPVCPPQQEKTMPDEAIVVAPQKQIIEGVVCAGDTAGKILNQWLTISQIHNMINAVSDLYSLTMIKVGQPYKIIASSDTGAMERFEYEIDDARRLIVEPLEDAHLFSASLEDIEYDYTLQYVEGVVEHSLLQAVVNAGESVGLGMLLADIFGWEVDFIRDIRPGDRFSALVEKKLREGKEKGYGRILAASFTNQGVFFEAFRFVDAMGVTAYYDRQGRSLRKSFLKAPLAFNRISSGFTQKRFHPILKINRPHPGIDYAAPTGTPVKSVASGVVMFRGWGNGYGNQVKVRHSGNIETMYSHLSKFAKGVTKGTKVQQGQVIGYVGSTGLSTGPHLDFRMRQNGSFINPAKLLNPRSEPVSKKNRPLFDERVAMLSSYMNGTQTLETYSRDMVLDKI